MTIKPHAVERFIQRHRPDLTPEQARKVLARLARRAARFWQPGEARNVYTCDGVTLVISRNALITVR